VKEERIDKKRGKRNVVEKGVERRGTTRER